MFNFSINTREKSLNRQDIEKENKIKFYIDCYIKELQRHFDISDRRMKIILFKVYKKMNERKFLKEFFSKIKISMLKSFKKEGQEF